jgi:hypothetical protein
MLPLVLALQLATGASLFDVRNYGAAGDGSTFDTAAIQKAIDAANQAGGGTVLFPAGRYLAGTIFLKSNVTLHLSPAAVLLGSTRISDYQPRHFLYAKNASNIAIEGAGAIDAQGDAFFDKDRKPLARPSPLIEIWDSTDVRIENVTIRKAPGWTIHPKNCDRVKIRGINILNNYLSINSDGIDPDSCRNVIISDCYIEAGDDCIVLKTTNRGGAAQPTENVTVTNCVLISAASALKLGTESHADFRHCVFSNCVIRNSRTGIALLAKDGGVMENIRFSNITMQTAPKWGKGVEWPIVVDLEKRAPESRISVIRAVSFSDITIAGKGRIMVTSLKESPLEMITFRNVMMRVTGYEAVEKAGKLRGGTVVSKDMPDYGPVPAAVILANIKGLVLDGFDLEWPGEDNAPARHALFADNVGQLTLRGFRAVASSGATPGVLLRNSRQVSFDMPGPGAAFLKLEDTPKSEVSFGRD